jgi:DNA-binding transcriptional MerR regulator
MRLVTAKEASKILYVTPDMVHYWATKSRIARYPDPQRPTRYLFDLDEAERASRTNKFNDKTTDKLITPTEAAKLIGVGVRSISYYVKMGYVSAHYVFENNNKHYLVDREEVLAQPELVVERMKHTSRLEELSKQGKAMPRSANGHWAKRTEPTND